MFTKYFGLILIVGGIVGPVVSLFFNGISIHPNTRSLIINDRKELFLGIFASITITGLITFLIGKYFYKAGASVNSKMNKVIKTTLSLSLLVFLTIFILFLVASIIILKAISEF